ncbi:MAG: hypothetical protein EBR82_02880 [Caulobacteraceae bacterium]|nr:hypothetical protein [Caulobacteraceae bacterium]
MTTVALDLDQLADLHERKRLRVATTIGAQGFVTMNDDPDLLVRELIRLARMGQRIEAVRLGIIRGGKS